MIIALLAAWVFGGLLLALLVGGAVRIADQRYHFTVAVRQAEAGPIEGCAPLGAWPVVPVGPLWRRNKNVLP